jgi:hypothetical protein
MQEWQYIELSCYQDNSGNWFWYDTNQSCKSLTYVDRLNQYGRQGWELVAVVPYASAWTYIFKRPQH